MSETDINILPDNPSGATCYGLSHAAMVAWIKDFSNTYHAKTKRYVVDSIG